VIQRHASVLRLSRQGMKMVRKLSLWVGVLPHIARAVNRRRPLAGANVFQYRVGAAAVLS